MHNESPVTPNNYWRDCAERAEWLWYIFLVAFDSKMTFEKHITSFKTSFSKACILRESWRVFHDRWLLVWCFRGFVLPVLEYCSVSWCSAADTHLKLLYRVVSGYYFWAGGTLECDIARRRSVSVLCLRYKISCNPMHPLNGALPWPYVPVQVTSSGLVAYQYTYAPPRYRTSQYRRTHIPPSVSLWNDLGYPVLRYWWSWWSCGWRVSRAGIMLIYWPSC